MVGGARDVAAAGLQDDRLDAAQVQEVGEQQAGRPGADDRDLRTHSPLLPPAPAPPIERIGPPRYERECASRSDRGNAGLSAEGVPVLAHPRTACSCPIVRDMTTADSAVGGPGLAQQRRIVTEIPGPASRALLERRQRSVARGLSHVLPVFVTAAGGGVLGQSFLNAGIVMSPALQPS